MITVKKKPLRKITYLILYNANSDKTEISVFQTTLGGNVNRAYFVLGGNGL